MHRTFTPMVIAGIVIGVMAGLAGCGGGNNPAPVDTGGSISGRTVDARTGVGLGGVTVSVTYVVITGTTVVTKPGTSTTPNGNFTISGVAPGSYSTLQVDAGPAYPAQADVVLAPPIEVTEGGVTSLPEPILVLDDGPPEPPPPH